MNQIADLHYNLGGSENLNIAAKWYRELFLYNKRLAEWNKEYYNAFPMVNKLIGIYKSLGIDDAKEVAKRIFGDSPTDEDYRLVQICWERPSNPFGF